MSVSQQIYIGSYVRVKFPEDFTLYDFIESFENEDDAGFLEDEFNTANDFSPDKDGFLPLLRNSESKDFKCFDTDDFCGEHDIPEPNWEDPIWIRLLELLSNAGLEFEKKIGIVGYWF